MVMIGKGSGFGKVILFGEHFAVYGLPAIASAICDQTTATIETAERYELVDDRPATEGYKTKKKDEMKSSMKLLLDFMKIGVGKTPVKITLSGDLFCTSGIGASAAMATSVARAFSEYLGLGLDDDRINRISYEGEKGSAGTPSGIDNTCATFGGLLWFVKNLEGGENTIEHIRIREPIGIVLGNTGLSSVTSEVVADVRKAKEADPEKYKKLFEEYTTLVKDARHALENHDLERLGTLMDENHRLLQQMGVSCGEAEEIIRIAKQNGALGAKITGTGRGGYVITLTPGKGLQEKVAKAIESQGFRTLSTTIGL